ncbi:MAG: SLC13 family permease, partial [Flavobacteriales bacterium]
SFVLRGDVQRPHTGDRPISEAGRREKNLVFIAGISSLLMVPVIKNTTHLPPFMGMMLSLGVLWLLTELIHSKKIMEEKSRFTALNALRKIDMPSVLFFLGILLAVSSLAEVGLLREWSSSLRAALGNVFLIDGAIGLLSSIVDNVPLVAAAKEMYAITPVISGDPWTDYFVRDGLFWQFLAFTAGTGGSILIIGSAAGVAVMGIERISFGWYLRKIAPWALLGYVAGGLAFVLQNA